MTQFHHANPPPIGGAKLVIVAILLASLAVVLNLFYISGIRRQASQDTFSVFVLTRSVLPGDRLRKPDVKRVTLPKVFEAGFKEMGALDGPGLDLRLTGNNQVQRSVAAGDILRFMHFEAPEGKDIDTKIPPGRRLVSLPVNSRTIPGALREGMSVDIEAPFQLGGALPAVLPVMENVKVIAVGSRTVYDENDAAHYRPLASYHSITVMVLPADATSLALIQRVIAGDFEIQLRNPGDQAMVKIKPDPLRPNSDINPRVLDLVEKRSAEPAAPKR